MEKNCERSGRHDAVTKSAACGADRSAPPETMEDFLERQALEERLSRIRKRILVMSGKGGVGKSTVAVNLAVALSKTGKKVGLLDVDIHGPSIPKMLHWDGSPLAMRNGSIAPVQLAGVQTMSVGFMLRQQDDALIWRGPMKMGIIRQFLKDVAWGDLDVLVIDAPPGTGDEPLSVAQLAAPLDGAVIVTTPQDVAIADVRKSIVFCRQLAVPVLGVLENMSGFLCPACKTVTDIFRAGGGERMAVDMGVPFLGRIPIDPTVAQGSDDGKPFIGHAVETPAARAFEPVVEAALTLLNSDGLKEKNNAIKMKGKAMKIAVPVVNGKLCMHFGHCEEFALVEADEAARSVVGTTYLTPPPHEPGVLPRWLHEQGAQIILAGGMGQRAQSLFAENGIKVVVGAPAEDPETLAVRYLEGTLLEGPNACDH